MSHPAHQHQPRSHEPRSGACGSRRSRRALVSVPVASIATLALVLGAPGAANADGHDSGGLLGQVGKVVEKTVKPVTDTVRQVTKAPSRTSGGSSSGSKSSSGSSSSSSRSVGGTVRKLTGSLSSRGSSSSSSSSSPSTTSGSSSRSSQGTASKRTTTSSSKPAAKAGGKPAAKASSPKAASGSSSTGEVANLDVVARDLLDLSRTGSTGSTSSAQSSAALVALAGIPVIGSSASTDGGSDQSSGPVPGNPLCSASMGTLCLDALYADSDAQAGNGSSTSSSRTGVADSCLLGHDATGETCDGVKLGVDQSDSQQRTTGSGSGSTSSSSLANLCIPGAALLGDDCAVSLDAVGSSSSAGNGATVNPEPTLLDLGLLGKHAALPKQPIDILVPKDCTDEFLLCSTLNQARSDGGAALDANVLDDAVQSVVGDSSSTSTSPSPTRDTGSGAPAAGPDFASADLADLSLADLPLANLSDNRSTGTKDSTQGDATLLSLLGQELIGAHADSAGQTRDGGSLLELPLCTATSGLICTNLLYADATASRTDTTRDAATETGVADTCLLGSDSSGAACDGLIVGVAQGSSALHSDSTTGTSTASSSSSLANTCLTASGGCLLSAEAVTATASSDNKGNTSSTSTLADLTLDGTTLGLPTNPIELKIPLMGEPNILDVLLNQQDTKLGQGAASVSSTVVGITGLGGLVGGDIAQTGVSTSDTNVVQPPTVGPPVVDPPVVDPPVVDPPTGTPPAGNPTTTGTGGSTTDVVAASGARAANVEGAVSADASTGALPNTGGVPASLLTWGILLLAAGAMIAAVARRRRTAWM